MENGNRVIGNPNLINTEVNFQGKNNILYCEDNVTIKNSRIDFKGDNAIVYLSENRHIYYFKVTIYNDSVLYFGKHNYINKRMYLILSEQKHIIIGDEGLFAIDCWIRTADPHILYDETSRKRINPSKSVLIGDHIWLGQEVLVLKGSVIGSGCILAARAIASGKHLCSNTIWGGNPLRILKQNVFHSKKSVNTFTEKETEKFSEFVDDRYIYKKSLINAEAMLNEVENNLQELNGDDRIRFLKDFLSNEDRKEHSRFYVGVN